MEQFLAGVSSGPLSRDGESTVVEPNIWLLSADMVPPILFSPEEVARLLGMGRWKVYELMRLRELRSVKVGRCRRVSARAVAEFVRELELREPA
jgi:excisionase family DNA binding protein